MKRRDKPLILLRIAATCLLSICLLVPSTSSADSHSRSKGISQLIYFPVGTQSEKSFHLVFPPQYRDFATKMENDLDLEYQSLEKTFGSQEGFRAQVQFMEAYRFYQKMKVPRWTNAIYIRSRIIIPVKTTELSHRGEIRRAIRHELVHAFVDHGSKGKCPGWLDEGLAQLLEGPEHPVLRAALKKWVRSHGVIPFSHLKSGFTKLPNNMVPAAYAQSLYSVKFLLAENGTESLRKLFTNIHHGFSFSRAFRAAFGKTQGAFEREFNGHLKTFAKGSERVHENSVWNISHKQLAPELPSMSGKASIDLDKQNRE